MQDEFDKLIQFFSLDSNDKEKKLEEIFQRSMEFFEKYNYVIAHGSEQEKAAIQKKMALLKAKLNEESEKVESKTGISSEEAKKIATDPAHFTAAQWELINKLQERLQKGKEEQLAKVEKEKQQRQEELKAKKKKKPSTKRSSWMKS